MAKNKDDINLEEELEENGNEQEGDDEEVSPAEDTKVGVDTEGEQETEAAEDVSLEDQLTQAKTEAAEYLDGWQRARAEFANYKKRVERETEEARQRIVSEILLQYLSIMDDLERALENAPENHDIQEWVSGIELIHQKFEMLLEAEGVESIEAEGERFDPNLHEAISYEDTEDHEGGSIIDVTQRGYKIGDRIIRPAMVRVAK